MKKIRLLIAKWALAADEITSDEILAACGIDIVKHVENVTSKMVEVGKQAIKEKFDAEVKSQIESIASSAVPKNIGDLTLQVLAEVIRQNSSLREDQKTALLGILQADNHADFYR